MVILRDKRTWLMKLAAALAGWMLLLILMPAQVQAAPNSVNWESLCVYGDEAVANTVIKTQELNGKVHMVLPSTVSPEAVQFELETSETAVVKVKGSAGEAELKKHTPVDLTALAGTGSSYDLTFTVTDGTDTAELSVKVLCSANVSAIYLVSDDPVNKGRAWVEASPDKSNKATGNMVMQNADGTVVYDGALTQIKGRGNSTWTMEKKPYQIKLDKKTDLLQTGNDENKSKTWVLLTNYSDMSLLHNTYALDLGIAMQMDSSIESEHVDLYYDGEYRGSYQLSEKVEVGSGRVDITDMEEANEEANPDKELDEFPIATGKTANGASYTYCEGMASPDDITGGYLLEMEASYRAVDEACYFWTSRNEYVVVKSPEYCSKAQMDYIASLYQEYEDALYGDGVNSTTGKHYTEYVNLKSTAQCYLINELSKNLDGFRTSAFLYKEAGNDVMTMGPLWDYDLGFGVGAGIQEVADLQKDPEGLYTVRSIFGAALYQHGDFREAVKEEWQNNLYPLLTEIVLADGEDAGTDSDLYAIDYYREWLEASASCDYTMWRGTYGSGSWKSAVNSFETYLSKRVASLDSILAGWNAEDCDMVSAFVDVELDDWYGEAINKAKAYGLMNGVGASIEHYPLFKPEDVSNRAAVAQVIYNMEGKTAVTYSSKFSDVAKTDWYADAVTWGAANGVINGYPDGTYGPDKKITREDMVTLLYRYSGIKTENKDAINSYNDAAKVSDYAKEAMCWAISEGVITGYPDSALRPQATINRAELATLLVRYYEHYILEKEPEEDQEVESQICVMYIESDDPETKGREWVESSKDKSNKATGSMRLLDSEGNVIYDGALTQIKGRGNSTWDGAKKPYQIKLDKKTDLLQTGDSDNATKTWVLLANYYDPALVRNTIALNLGNAMGMETCVESTYVDLYYDGEYRGCYLLAEKVEVGSGRVDIIDMEDLNEEANPEVDDLGDLEIKVGTTENGAAYTYCDGMNSPENITGGYLLEMDFEDRAKAEACYFYTTRNNYVVVKSPEYASKEEMDYIAALYQEYEDAVYNGGVNPDTGKEFTEYVDLESTVQCCLINEFVRNVDAFKSSTYLYKDADSDIMTMGPLWDYDLSMGMDSTTYSFSVSPEGMNTSMGNLANEIYKLTDFRKLAKEMYAEVLYPLVTEVVLGDVDAVSEDGSLHSLTYYEALIKESAKADDLLWVSDYGWEDATDDLREFISARAEYLKIFFADWSDEYDSSLTFIDVAKSDWYYDSVYAAVEYGLMNGISNSFFDPEVTAVRSQVTQVLYNMADVKDITYKSLFTDVKENDWYALSVTWAAENGIVKGYLDGTFGPGKAVSREDLMVFLYRYHGSPQQTGNALDKFTDKSQISDYALDAMQWAVAEGMIEGYTDNTVQPQKSVTRAELAVILVRYYEKYELTNV